MNLRWLLLDYVDPALNLTRAERIWVRQRASTLMATTRPWKGQQRWLAAVQPLIPATFTFGPLMLWRVFGGPKTWAIPFIILSLVVMWMILTWINARTWRPYITAALREKGIHLCECCGYWLRGLAPDAPCPECGHVNIGLAWKKLAP